MFLTVHTASALIIASQTSRVDLAFILGFISHFALDLIPHDPKEIKEWLEKGKENKKLFFITLVDLFISLVLVIFLQTYTNFILTKTIFICIIGALLPDFLWGFYYLTKISFLRKFTSLHHENHKLIFKNPYLSLKYAVLIQLTFLLIFLFIILKFL